MRASAAAVSVAILALTAAPAGAESTVFCDASALTAPDGKIRVGTLPYEGKGDYSYTPVGVQLAPGEQATFVLRWKNVSSSIKAILIQRDEGDSFQDPGFGVRYFLLGEKVNDQVKGGPGLLFLGIEPGKKTIKLELRIKNKTGDTGSVRQDLRGNYGAVPKPECDKLEAGANL